jgi:hypothetical protein
MSLGRDIGRDTLTHAEEEQQKVCKADTKSVFLVLLHGFTSNHVVDVVAPRLLHRVVSKRFWLRHGGQYAGG